MSWWQNFTFYPTSLLSFLLQMSSAITQTGTVLCDEYSHAPRTGHDSVTETVKPIRPQNVLALYQKTKCTAQTLILWNFPNQFQMNTHFWNNRNTVSKDCRWSSPNPPSPALSHSPSHLLCALRGKNKWGGGQHVYACMFGREKHKWTCKRFYERVCLRAHGHIGMHQCLWHMAGPRLDLTLCWMPLWRQADFVWPHASTEEAMEKICGPVSLWDYMAPLSSGLNNASNPIAPCHCNLRLSSLEKNSNLCSITDLLVTDTLVHEHVNVCMLRKELVRGCTRKGSAC